MMNVSSSPHVRDHSSTSRIMLDVIIALLPACIFGILNFGWQALVVLVVSVAASVFFEFLYQKLMHKPILVGDLSAVLTGLLIGMNMPSSIPIWMVVIGDAFAIIIVKQLFGGLGQNFMNPALAARCFLLISFAGAMTSFTYTGPWAGFLAWDGVMSNVVDGVTGATPLAMVKNNEAVNLLSMFIGTTGGVIGETSTLALLIGAAYLLIRRVILPIIPMSYILTFSVFTIIYRAAGGYGFDLYYLACELCGGGLILGAFFMATDYVTSPVTPLGRVIFGICLGILTGVFRFFGNSAEGVSYAIIFCNLLVPLIEKISIPRAFGVVKEKKVKNKEAV